MGFLNPLLRWNVGHGCLPQPKISQLATRLAGSPCGAHVYNTMGESLGEIEDLMIDEITGRVEFAVVSSGGFLGRGRKHYPLPWPVLLYNSEQHGYVVNMSKAEVEDAGRPI
jgi:sporulation protein YlmC with PRC-barrel domain